MVQTNEIRNLCKKFKSVSIGVLGSHSALDVCEGAKEVGISNLVVCQKGREKVYSKYYKYTKKGKNVSGCVDQTIVLDSFKDIIKQEVQKNLLKQNIIFVPNRSFAVYVGYDAIENDFAIPIFGNRYLLRAEERNIPKNQQFLLQKANIPIPKTFSSPEKIDRLCLIKVSEAKRTYERAFFFASNPEEYYSKSKALIDQGIISKEGLEKALIEEFVIGAHFNFNFFYSPIFDRLELLGIDTRRQTNLDGFIRLPYFQQKELPNIRISNIEVGHISCTIRESFLEQVFEIGTNFVQTTAKFYEHGLIGPFALQGAIVPSEEKEKIVIFDVSFRVPGSPGTAYTPYSKYLFGENMSVGKRIAIEIKQAFREKRLDEIVT
jgi:5-formaminoimidazole-4-carboxamide-1-(beta)-D-ribofuranosyl 5'-monophosphate synthetase